MALSEMAAAVRRFPGGDAFVDSVENGDREWGKFSLEERRLRRLQDALGFLHLPFSAATYFDGSNVSLFHAAIGSDLGYIHDGVAQVKFDDGMWIQQYPYRVVTERGNGGVSPGELRVVLYGDGEARYSHFQLYHASEPPFLQMRYFVYLRQRIGGQ